MLTNKEILDIAVQQSAWDNNCRPEDFEKAENVVVSHRLEERSRKYLREPIACNFVSYGGNLVASVKDEYRSIVEEYIGKFPYYHCFETPNMHWLSDRLAPLGQKICFMAEYFLPDVEMLYAQKPLGMTDSAILPGTSDEFSLRWGSKVPGKSSMCHLQVLLPPDFENLYLPQWENALCEGRKELDVLGVGAYDGEKLVGLAACSADGEEMWQIGVDVLPEYRRLGIASAVTRRLALEILERGKVPFYCCAWSNVASVRNAISSGFKPAWVEMTVKPSAKVDAMNE